MKIIIIIQLAFTLLNLGAAFWQVKLKNYKIAILNGFASGFCCMGILYELSQTKLF